MNQKILEQTGAIVEHTGAINGPLDEGTGAMPAPDLQEAIKPDLVFQPETGDVRPRRQVEELIDFFPPEKPDLSTKDGSFERLVTVARAVGDQRGRLAELYGEEEAKAMSAIAQGAIFGSGKTAIDAAKIHGHEVPDEIPPQYSAFVQDALVLSAADDRDKEQAKSAAFVLTGKNSKGESYTPTPTAARGPAATSTLHIEDGAREIVPASGTVPQGQVGRVAMRQLTRV